MTTTKKAKETTTTVNPFKVVTSSHRVSFVHIKEPSAFEEGGDLKYDITLLIPKDHPDVDKIKATIKALYAANKESLFKGLPFASPRLWNPLRDGDELAYEKEAVGEDYGAYRGCYYLRASSKSQPKVFDSDKQDIIDLDEIYSGCYCRAVIVGKAFDNKSKGFGFYINSVMKIDEGERLGGFAASADDYDSEEDLS